MAYIYDELIKAQLENAAANPSALAEGLVYWQTTNKRILIDSKADSAIREIPVYLSTAFTVDGALYKYDTTNKYMTDSGLKVSGAYSTAGVLINSAAGLISSEQYLSVARGGTGLGSVTAGYIPFGSSASALSTSANLFWDNANIRLGIGKTPAVVLDILAANPSLRLSGTSTNDSVSLRFDHSTPGNDQTWYMAMQGSSPITGSANKDLVIQDGNNYNYITFKNAATSRDILIDPTAAGRIAIGTASPDCELDVRSSLGDSSRIKLKSTSATDHNMGFVIQRDKSGGSLNCAWQLYVPKDGQSLIFYENGARLTLGNDGSITAPDVYSDTVGATNRDLYIDNTGLIGYLVSSIRYKKNIEPYTPKLKDVIKLEPKQFDYKDGRGHDYGMIAEEVEKIFPELISYGKDGSVETISYSKLPVILLSAIKELKNEIDQLKIKLG